MRGLLLRALPVCFVAAVAGCFNMPGVGTSSQPPTATHVYWQQVNGILSQKPNSTEMKDLSTMLQKQNDALGKLSTEGVDPELVSTVAELIQCEEKVIEVAATADNNPAVLQQNQIMAQSFDSATRKASEVRKKLKAMRSALNARCGSGFVSAGW
jgi:hypothetical protein